MTHTAVRASPLLVLSLAAVAACHDTTVAEARVRLVGSWAFVAPAPSYMFDFSQSDSTITGQYVLERDPAVLMGPVAGHLHGDLLALSIDTGLATGGYRARFVTPTRLTGTLTEATGDTLTAVLEKITP